MRRQELSQRRRLPRLHSPESARGRTCTRTDRGHCQQARESIPPWRRSQQKALGRPILGATCGPS
eukprot:2969201-Prorocentrum_lima.AAC.1